MRGAYVGSHRKQGYDAGAPASPTRLAWCMGSCCGDMRACAPTPAHLMMSSGLSVGHSTAASGAAAPMSASVTWANVMCVLGDSAAADNRCDTALREAAQPGQKGIQAHTYSYHRRGISLQQ